MTSNASLVGATVLLVVLLALYGYVRFGGYDTSAVGARQNTDASTEISYEPHER